MASFKKRVKRLRTDQGLSQSDVAQGAGVSQKTVSRYENSEEGPEKESSSLKKFARFFGVQTDWLLTGQGERLASGQGDSTRRKPVLAGEEDGGDLPSGMRYLPLASVAANGGDGELPYEIQVERHVAYDEATLRRSGIDPMRAIFLPVTGSSMEPTISPGNSILVERYGGEPLQDGAIYVFRREDYGYMVKRVFWAEDGCLELRSDNDLGPTLRIRPEEDHDWIVVGHVKRVEKSL